MMKKIFLTISLLTITFKAYSQSGILNAESPENISFESEFDRKNTEKLDNFLVNEQDIMWSKTLWEVIDLDEKINFRLYYPIDTLGVSGGRRSLYDVFLKAIKKGEITEVYADSYFNQKIDYDEVVQNITKIDTLDAGLEQLNAGESVSEEYITKIKISSRNIQEFRVRGVWYFNRRIGALKYELLAIAPVSRDVNFLEDPTSGLVELFWVWFKDARETLHRAKSFNPNNPSKYITYDHLLTSRHFNSVIYKEDNVYNDRSINEYITDNAYLRLMESQRIKDDIRDLEEDMWSY